MQGWGQERRWQRGLRGCVVGRRDGEQRASFRVDRSGGLYQNNTFVGSIKKRRGDGERTRLKANIFAGLHHVLNELCKPVNRPLKRGRSSILGKIKSGRV